MSKDYVYLATPYSNYKDGKEAAYGEAVRQASFLIKAGINTFSPIAHSHPLSFHGIGSGYDTWQGFDEKMLDGASHLVICMMDGWDKSEGVRAEIQYYVTHCDGCMNYMMPGVVPRDLFLEATKGSKGIPELVAQNLKPVEPDKKRYPLEVYDEAVQKVTQQRGEVYGHPSVNFNRIQRLKSVTDECRDPELREAMEMICVKLARLIETPTHTDSWIDISGFSRTGVMVLDKRERDNDSDSGESTGDRRGLNRGAA